MRVSLREKASRCNVPAGGPDRCVERRRQGRGLIGNGWAQHRPTVEGACRRRLSRRVRRHICCGVGGCSAADACRFAEDRPGAALDGGRTAARPESGQLLAPRRIHVPVLRRPHPALMRFPHLRSRSMWEMRDSRVWDLEDKATGGRIFLS